MIAFAALEDRREGLTSHMMVVVSLALLVTSRIDSCERLRDPQSLSQLQRRPMRIDFLAPRLHR